MRLIGHIVVVGAGRCIRRENIMSAGTVAEISDEAIGSGANRYLGKPSRALNRARTGSLPATDLPARDCP